MTMFTITSYYDPYGDLKSARKVFKIQKFVSDKSQSEVQAIVDAYNAKSDYYSAIDIKFSEHKKPGRPFANSLYARLRGGGETAYVSI